MVVISIGLEMVLLLWTLGEYIAAKRSGQAFSSLLPQFLWPIGRKLAAWRELPEKKKETHKVYQILTQLTGPEEADTLFYQYRCKRWGMLIGVILLCNAVWAGWQLWLKTEPQRLDLVQVRPSYGEGDQRQQVTVIVDGLESQVQETFSLLIPEQSITEEQAKEQLNQAVQYIQTYLEGRLIYEDIELPTGWQDVSFFYETLSPQLVLDNGDWVGELKQERQEIQIQVTAAIGGMQQSVPVRLWSAALSDLTAQDQLEQIASNLAEGLYTNEQTVTLPGETQSGEKLTWYQEKDSVDSILLLMLVLLPAIALWKQDQEYQKIIKEREQRIRHVYPEFINELVILVGAGLSLPAAWRRIGMDYQNQREEGKPINPLYEEVYRESQALGAGSSMREVLEQFSLRIRLREARRFAVLLTQNLKRGDAFLISRLRELNQEAWDMRKRQVRKQSEEADTKLLLPLILMLVVILIIVLSPAIISMQG